MTLTVAVCTRSRPASLDRCLRSLVGAVGLLHEVVVSSDGVDRDTDEVVDAYRGVLPMLHLRGPRTGLAGNRNTCVEHATGQTMLFLDDDARLHEDFLPAALPLASRSRLVTGCERWPDGNVVTPVHPDLLGFLREAPVGALSGLVINSTLFPRPFLREAGFDPFFRFGSEEAEIALCARSRGLNIVQVQEGNWHDRDSGARDGNDDKARRSRAYFNARRYTRYQPSAARLVASAGLGIANGVGHVLRTQGVRAGLRTARSMTGATVQGACRPRPALLPECAPAGPLADPDVSVSVVVPTYRRAEQLKECLDGLARQRRAPDQVLVVCRADDAPAREVVRQRPGVEECLVNRPGQTAALLAGARACRGDVIVFTDDDAVPRADWLQWLVAPYADPTVGAVGGRDIVHHLGEVEDGAELQVGLLLPTGRAVGAHHLGVGRLRDVWFLKGVNLSCRRELLAIPAGLRGTGAEVACDTAMSLAVRQAGHRVLFEPRALVDHFPGRRFDADRRRAVDEPSPAQVRRDRAYNETYVLSSLVPALRRRRAAYGTLVGDRASVGLLRAVVANVRGETGLRGALRPCFTGLLEGTRDARRRPLTMRPVV